MTTTKIDSLNLTSDLVAKLRAEVLYDDATLEAATAVDVATLPIGLKIRLRTVFPNVAEHPRTQNPVGVAHLIVPAATRVNPLLAGINDRSEAVRVVVSKIADGEQVQEALDAALARAGEAVPRG